MADGLRCGDWDYRIAEGADGLLPFRMWNGCYFAIFAKAFSQRSLDASGLFRVRLFGRWLSNLLVIR